MSAKFYPDRLRFGSTRAKNLFWSKNREWPSQAYVWPSIKPFSAKTSFNVLLLCLIRNYSVRQRSLCISAKYLYLSVRTITQKLWKDWRKLSGSSDCGPPWILSNPRPRKMFFLPNLIAVSQKVWAKVRGTYANNVWLRTTKFDKINTIRRHKVFTKSIIRLNARGRALWAKNFGTLCVGSCRQIWHDNQYARKKGFERINCRDHQRGLVQPSVKICPVPNSLLVLSTVFLLPPRRVYVYPASVCLSLSVC